MDIRVSGLLPVTLMELRSRASESILMGLDSKTKLHSATLCGAPVSESDSEQAQYRASA
jgi:hypothetical protein